MKKAIFFLTVIYSSLACAYETDTHAMITSRAFERSTLPSVELQRRLGLERFPEDKRESRPFQAPTAPSYGGLIDAYFDTGAAGWSSNFSMMPRRGVLDYERKKMYSLPGEDYKDQANEHRIKAWLMRGAIREDDLPPANYKSLPVPDSDPHGDLARVFQHFFNPLNNAGLQPGIPCSALPDNDIDKCSPSTDWAFGTIGITS